MRKLIVIPLLAVFLVSLGCTLTLPFSQKQEQDVDLVATWVAETLSAVTIQGLDTPTPLSISSGEKEGILATEEVIPEVTPLSTALPDAIQNPPPPGHDHNLLRVAYAIDDQLFLWTEGSGDQVLFSGESVEQILLSDDGWVIVFTTRNADYMFNGLWRVNADGSDLRMLLDSASLAGFKSDALAMGVSPNQMEFAPGTRDLAFNTRLVFMGPGLLIQDDLRLLNTETGELKTLLESGMGGAFTYSPDGSQIALVSPTSVGLVQADGNNLRSNLVTYPMVLTYSEYQYYPWVVWERDGNAFWVVVPSEDAIAPDASMAYWRMDVANGMPALMATFPFDLSLFFAGPVLSPNLLHTVYLQRTQSEANLWTLHVAELDGTPDISMRIGNLRFENWNPDGTWLTIEQEGVYWVGDLAGNFRPMTDIQPAIDVRWIDPGRFLFLSGDYEAMQLRLGSLSGPSQAIGSISEGVIHFSFSVGVR